MSTVLGQYASWTMNAPHTMFKYDSQCVGLTMWHELSLTCLIILIGPGVTATLTLTMDDDDDRSAGKTSRILDVEDDEARQNRISTRLTFVLSFPLIRQPPQSLCSKT